MERDSDATGGEERTLREKAAGNETRWSGIHDNISENTGKTRDVQGRMNDVLQTPLTSRDMDGTLKPPDSYGEPTGIKQEASIVNRLSVDGAGGNLKNGTKTRVGQWVSKAEYEQFVKTGKIPRTNEVVQVSNKFDPNWVPDKTIIDPYLP